MIWQSVNFGRKILICTCPQQRSCFFFCLISLSPLFKLLHVKVYHPLAVPQHTARCWHANSKIPTHNNIKKWLLLLLSQESCSALGVGGLITTFITDHWGQWTIRFRSYRLRNHIGMKNATQTFLRIFFSYCGDLLVIFIKRLLFTSSLVSLKYF